MKNNSALFYACSLIEFIGRERKMKRSEVVRILGEKTIRQIYRYADVFHCEPIAKTADDFITNLNIPEGAFDNVASCRYEVPDYWTIGEVYERLIEDISGDDEAHIVARLMEVYAHGSVTPSPTITQTSITSRGTISASAIGKEKSALEFKKWETEKLHRDAAVQLFTDFGQKFGKGLRSRCVSQGRRAIPPGYPPRHIESRPVHRPQRPPCRYPPPG